jgi:prephenate dehydrogenase
MNFKRVAIIGVDPISTSIALGLKAQKEPPTVVGYHPKRMMAELARARGAFDRIERKPDRACRDADLVIVAVPLSSIRDTFAAIAPSLQPGCLVTDTARLKGPVMRWAEELLPENISFIGGHPILNPAIVGFGPPEEAEEADADFLRGALYCYTLPVGVSNVAVNAFLALAKMLGTHPFSIDATEHDGMQAGAEGLPDLLAVALLRATVDTPGWREMRKFAGYRFATTAQAADDAHECHTTVFLNRENVLSRVNLLLEELTHLRDLLTQDDAGLLEETFAAAAESRAHWIHEAERGLWGTEGPTNMGQIPSASQQFRQIFLGERLSRRKDKS